MFIFKPLRNHRCQNLKSYKNVSIRPLIATIIHDLCSRTSVIRIQVNPDLQKKKRQLQKLQTQYNYFTSLQ
jgi:hypothetical protein